VTEKLRLPLKDFLAFQQITGTVMLMEIPLSKRGGAVCLVIGIILLAIAIPFYVPIFNLFGFIALFVGIYVVWVKKHK
jgi:hypothetical protein